MAIYRSDQAQLTFAAEAAQGADPELMQGTASGSTALLKGAHSAGARSILIDTIATADLVVGDFIRIGTVEGTYANTKSPHEVRRIEAISGTQQAGTTPGNEITLTLDRPIAFSHVDNVEVKEVTGVGNESDLDEDHSKLITWIPGIYETVDTPDPEMSIEGRRFLNTNSKRDFSVAYAGQQTLTGSVSGIMLLNGWPLRFPIGTVKSTASAYATDTINLDSAVSKGDIFIAFDGDEDNIVVGDYIQIVDADGGNSEIRRVVRSVDDYNLLTSESGTNTVKLNYPLHFDHAEDAVVNEITHSSSIVYTHVIEEAVDLSTVSWHVHMKDSSETAAKDFDRRYVGGMIGSSTITAEEGGMVTMSWDSVNFLNMTHNQANQKTLASGGSSAPASGDLYYGASVAANMPRYALMQPIDTNDVGMPSSMATITDENAGAGYPSTQPYYFSEGTIKFFGQEFARIRSFSLSITNNEEPRYYIGKQGARARGPYEIREGARDYGMSASIALPDADVAASATAANASQDSALELFRQLLLEGNYGANSGNMKGFSATIKFERGANDSIIIDIPGSSTAGSPTATASGLNSQGIFINSAPHSITTDNPFQIDVDMIFRSLKITITDNVPVYP
jgi:hypothetical protein